MGEIEHDDTEDDWPAALHAALGTLEVRQVAYVPDAGHRRLIELAVNDARMRAVALTSEEEGVGLAAGAWLGGERSVLLMQSSGVGNIVNGLASLTSACALPLVLVVTMRGEWAEFNPWQVPMARATRTVLEAMDVRCEVVSSPEAVTETVAAAIDLAYGADQAVAVLLSQRLIGRKRW